MTSRLPGEKAKITALKGFKDAVMSPSAAPKLARGVWPPASAKAPPVKKAAAPASKSVAAKASPATVTKAPARRSIGKASASKSTLGPKTAVKKR
jgi:hypothetical protein